MPGWRAIVTGRVQGVGFRAYVLDEANRLELRGEVWNRTDGSVELVFAHESPERLESMVESLRRGPGRLDHVYFTRGGETVSFDGFRIGATRP
ncbi:MAG TPA: acylphosphatase [Fimbriimonadaceae bacterium]|nr:acylphosphatase [Fimbriimonadaceae bacterium]